MVNSFTPGCLLVVGHLGVPCGFSWGVRAYFWDTRLPLCWSNPFSCFQRTLECSFTLGTTLSTCWTLVTDFSKAWRNVSVKSSPSGVTIDFVTWKRMWVSEEERWDLFVLSFFWVLKLTLTMVIQGGVGRHPPKEPRLGESTLCKCMTDREQWKQMCHCNCILSTWLPPSYLWSKISYFLLTIRILHLSHDRSVYLANFQRVPQSCIHWACCAISVTSGTLKITLNLRFHLLFPLGVCSSRIFASFSKMTFERLADLCSLLSSLKVLFCFPFIPLLPLFKVYIERQICGLNYGCLKGNPKCNTQFRKAFLDFFFFFF